MKARSIASTFLLLSVPMLQGCNDTTPVEAKTAQGNNIPGAVFSMSGNGPVYRTQLNGDHASYYASLWENGTSTSVYLDVGQNGRGANATVWMYFSVDRCVTGDEWWTECVWTGGGGTIPAHDFTGNLQQGFTLNTDTRTNPDFYLWNGEGGVISVQWSPTGYYEFTQSGSSEYRWFNTISRTSGTTRSTSAAATGSILGLDLPQDGYGYLSSGRGVSMAFERAPTGSR